MLFLLMTRMSIYPVCSYVASNELNLYVVRDQAKV